MGILDSKKPQRVWKHFERMCAIPHGSGNTARISDYCVSFAREHHLSYQRDASNNVIIYKPATPGYEKHPPVILQSHLDMVCVKDKGCPVRFDTDGLDLRLEGDEVYACGTSLGADDGIGVSMILAALEEQDLRHPRLEALLTTDEETGMFGAAALDPSLLEGRTMINIDSEEEGILTCGCAGGAKVELHLAVTSQPSDAPCYTIHIDGLQGGHSGMDINKGRLSANILLSRLLSSLSQSVDMRIVALGGGQKDNAIPCQAFCTLALQGDGATLEKLINDVAVELRVPQEPGLHIYAVPDATSSKSALTAESTQRIIQLLADLPNGIQKMSESIEGLVQTSLNIGILALDENGLCITASVRSSVNAEKQALLSKLKAIGERHGASYHMNGEYPAWEFKENSSLRHVMCDTFEALYNKPPVVDIIHAGLECGIFSDKLPGLDAVSFGPDLFNVHTSKERASIPSVERSYRYLCETLKNL